MMKSDETVEELFDRLDALAYLANASEAEIWTNFHRGLTPEVSDKMLIPEPSWALQELVRRAVATQRYIRQSAITARRRSKAMENLTTISEKGPAKDPTSVESDTAKAQDLYIMLAMIKDSTSRLSH